MFHVEQSGHLHRKPPMNHTFPLDLSALQRALASLEDGLEVVSDSDWFNQQSPKVQNTLVAGVIQNFEFVYEVGVKMLKRQIEQESASPDEVDHASFRDVLRLAAEKGLIDNVEAWFGYRQMRNITAHTYDHDKAQQVYQGALLARLEARNA